MKNLVIKKWIEPYRLLETIKKYCSFEDYTFDGSNKFAQKTKMFSKIENEEKFALYMKNVNKFYLFNCSKSFDLESLLIETFEFTEQDYEFNEDNEKSLSLIDMGKAEASFLNIL